MSCTPILQIWALGSLLRVFAMGPFAKKQLTCTRNGRRRWQREEKEIITCRTSIKWFKPIHMPAILPLKDESSNAADTYSFLSDTSLLSSLLIAKKLHYIFSSVSAAVSHLISYSVHICGSRRSSLLYLKNGNIWLCDGPSPTCLQRGWRFREKLVKHFIWRQF